MQAQSRVIDEISGKARFQGYAGAQGGITREDSQEGAGLRRAEAPGKPSALRFPAGVARSAAFVGDTEGTIARSIREAVGDARRRSSP